MLCCFPDDSQCARDVAETQQVQAEPLSLEELSQLDCDLYSQDCDKTSSNTVVYAKPHSTKPRPNLLIFLALHNKKYKIVWDEVARKKKPEYPITFEFQIKNNFSVIMY